MSVAPLEKQLQRIKELKASGPWGQDYDFWLATTRKVVSSVAGREYLPFLKEKELAPVDIAFDKIAKLAGKSPTNYHSQLNSFGETLQRIIGELRIGAVPASEKKKVAKVDESTSYELHPLIKSVSSDRYEAGQFADAVEAAFKEVIRRVKYFAENKTGEKYLNAVPMMEKVFLTEPPIIAFNQMCTDEEKNEQKGLGYLFKGIAGIRNRKAHENVVLDDPLRAFEYLSLASLQMRLLDEHAK